MLEKSLLKKFNGKVEGGNSIHDIRPLFRHLLQPVPPSPLLDRAHESTRIRESRAWKREEERVQFKD